MKYLVIALLLISVAACERGDETSNTTTVDPQNMADQAVADAKDMVDQAMQGKAALEGGEGTEKCAIFDSGLIPQLFDVDDSVVEYQRSVPFKRAGHVVCSASWDKPNKAELDAAYQTAFRAWVQTTGQPDRKPQPKSVRSTNKVSLSLLGDSFSSANDAVVSLEQKVVTLTKGITVTRGDITHTSSLEFGDWVDGIGDKGIFTDNGDLMIAANGKQITVTVRAMENAKLDHEKAIELARKVIPQL